ncbi:RNA-directed DNA polymerase, eukaryota [Tanacetum coccineum]
MIPVSLDILPTRLNLAHRGVQVSSLDCPICSLVHESSSHILFSCSMATDIARLICRWWDLGWSPFGSYVEWLSWFKNVKLGSILKTMLEGVFYVAWWSIWIFRNQLLFASCKPRKNVLFDDIVARSFMWCNARSPECPFIVNGHTYRKCYYLADGIYPEWSTFVKTFSVTRDAKTFKFKTVQESARKDIERAFGDYVIKDLGNVTISQYSIRRACYKEPHKITKVVRRANETLPAFKERWTVETGLIMGVPEVMKISSFMDSVKSPELAKRFSSNIPKTVDEMMRRVDEFVRAEEAYARTELPPGESRDIHRRLSFPTGPRDVHQRLTFPTSTRNDMDNRSSQRRDYKGNDYKSPYKVRDNFNSGRQRDYRAPYPQRDQANKAVP